MNRSFFHTLAAALMAAALFLPAARAAQSDAAPLVDPLRPVREITPTSVTLQWFTSTPCATRAQIRPGEAPVTTWRPGRLDKQHVWNNARIAQKQSAPTTFHVLTIRKLAPGRRYFYRVFDPGATPTRSETVWGASAPWRREYAVSTTAGAGRRTILRVPVKVLLMPNVVNVASAVGPGGAMVPPPPAMTGPQLARIRDEYAVTSRFLFVNSGLRFWVDFQIQVDARWQRWGSEAPGPYKNWPVCRSWAGVDFKAPGGGRFTIVDTKDPLRARNAPVLEEKPFAAQIEQAFVRRWSAKASKWELVASGGGTLGVDGFPRGVPGRSQYLGGSDTAWLAAHEFHHQMESQSAFSLSHREDDRIVFNHPAPRSRASAWNTAGRHGEHWDVLAFWDRTLTDVQWLRSYFGETITVADRDNDGVPDNEPRLPLDERRWGSSPHKFATDGRLNDLAKIQLSTWAPAPLQTSFAKPPLQAIRPNPTTPDTDNDGLFDDVDPYPLYPYPPVIGAMTATIDGDAREWAAVPLAGQTRAGVGRPSVSFRQSHDDAAYYACIMLRGPWQKLRVTLDGEGKGVFSGQGVQGFELTNNDTPALRPQWNGAPGLTWKARRTADKLTTVLEFSFPNRGEGAWFWDRGGREIGAVLEVTGAEGKIYSMYEPYRLFYARMLEPAGRPALPTANVPAELSRDQATRVFLGGAGLTLTGTGWRHAGALVHQGEAESTAFVDVAGGAREFDLWMRFEAKQDAILGAFTPGTTPGAGTDYIAFVGGYANTQTRLRLFGREIGESNVLLLPGAHTMQLSRRRGAVWCLLDGKPILHAPDPDPQKVIDRLAIIGGYNGDQIIHEVRVRTTP